MVTAMVSPSARASARKIEPDDALSRVRDDHVPGGFPAGRAQRQSRFALIAGDRQKHFARDRNDERNDHDREHHARREQADAVERAAEKAAASRARREWPARLSAGAGTRTKIPSRPIDHAGNRGQQLDQEGEGVGDFRRAPVPPGRSRRRRPAGSRSAAPARTSPPFRR